MSTMRNTILTSLVIDLQMCGGEVHVHVVLEDLLKEALSLPQLQLLGRIHVRNPLSVLSFRWRTEQHTHFNWHLFFRNPIELTSVWFLEV